jgi:hypothetical protein
LSDGGISDQPRRELANVTSYNDLHVAMRARAAELKISRAEIDRLAGLASGHAGKLLAPRPLKRLGDDLVGFVIPALAMKLVLIEDLQSLAQIRARSRIRDERAVRSAAVEFTISRRFLRRIGKKGGANSRKYMTRARASALSRKANMIRWRDVKAAVRRQNGAG